MKYNVIERITKFIDVHEILRDYETFEQMPIYHRYNELNCLKYSIQKEYYLSFLINIAIMYVNQGILYAKSKLSDAEWENYLIYFGIEWDEEKIEDMGVSRVDVYFTRKAKEHVKLFDNNYCKSIDYKNSKIYKYVKYIIGISEFNCYHSKWIDEYEEVNEDYYFVPKILDRVTVHSRGQI
jgi:hypothetical protein